MTQIEDTERIPINDEQQSPEKNSGESLHAPEIRAKNENELLATELNRLTNLADKLGSQVSKTEQEILSHIEGGAHVESLYTNDPIEKIRAVLALLELKNPKDTAFVASLADLRTRLDAIDMNNISKSDIKFVLYEERLSYSQYLESFNLKEEDLTNIDILDVGAGSRELAGYCLRNNINTGILSLEPRTMPEPDSNDIYQSLNYREKIYLNRVLSPQQRAQLDQHTITAERENIPLKDESQDLLLCEAAMPGFQEEDPAVIQKEVESTFNESVRLLRTGGMAMFEPFFHGTTTERWKPWTTAIETKLKDLEKEGKVKVIFEKIGSRELLGEEVFRIVIIKLGKT